MGCLCPNFFLPEFKPCYLTPETTFNFEFSSENDNSFYIPVKYSSISTLLTLILDSEPNNWLSYKSFLHESKEYLHQTLNSIDNFLFQEISNLESSSFPKEKLILNSGEMGSPLKDSKDSMINSPNFDYYQKFRLKTFQLEINRLIFLGDNDPNLLNLGDPFIEIEISNEMHQYIFTTKPINSKKKDFIWNELVQIPLAQNIEKSELMKSHFDLSVYFIDKNTRKKRILGEKYRFSFSELTNQMLFEKNIKIRNPNDRNIGGFYAILLFRCQVIYDYFILLNYWKKEIEVKLEIIQRMCQKIMVEEKGQKLRKIALNNYNNKQEIEIIDQSKNEEKKKNKANFSLMSGEGS